MIQNCVVTRHSCSEAKYPDCHRREESSKTELELRVIESIRLQWCPQASPVRAACLRLAVLSTKQASKPKGRDQASKHMSPQAAWLCLIHFWIKIIARYHVYTCCPRRAPITKSELALSEGSQTTACSRPLEIHAGSLVPPLWTLSLCSCRSVYHQSHSLRALPS